MDNLSRIFPALTLLSPRLLIPRVARLPGDREDAAAKETLSWDQSVMQSTRKRAKNSFLDIKICSSIPGHDPSL